MKYTKERKSYTYVCERCGATFYSYSAKARWCEPCRVIVRNERNKQWRRSAKNRQAEIRLPLKKTINDILRDLRKYNEEHNTHLTYGQYVAMIEKREF